jgi:hypothetical protein
MHGKHHKIPYSKDLKPRNMLTPEALDRLAQVERQTLEQARLKSRRPNAQVQMSIRMEEEIYLRFKALCKTHRQTNGEMLRLLMQFYLQEV